MKIEDVNYFIICDGFYWEIFENSPYFLNIDIDLDICYDYSNYSANARI